MHNFKEIKKRSGDKKVLAVVKANAYGHGATVLSTELESLGVDYFGVAILPEGIELREAGIRTPILLLNGVFQDEEDDVVRYDLTPVVYSIESINRLSEAASRAGKSIPVHVKIDTGMKRLGIMPEEIPSFFRALKDLGNIRLEGVISHFATSDSRDRGFMDAQMAVFRDAVAKVREIGFNPEYIHIENSAAMIRDELSEILNMVRPGITLYGSYPSIWFREELSLRPVMTFKSEIIQIKKVSKGESVSYARKFIAERDSIVGIVPAGYADGYPRHLSNLGEALVKGRAVKVAGIVCMDLIVLDLTNIPDASVGDEVILWGRSGDAEISADELARKAGTISYEMFCGVSARVPRVYVRQGKD